MRIPNHIEVRRKENPAYYSLYRMDNIERCKVDPEYLGEVMLVNEPLIWHSIHKYVGNPNKLIKGAGIDKEDILQLGREGFIKAVKAFDTTRGVKFSSFAVIAIVREVRCYLRDNVNIIRLTRTAHAIQYEVKKIEHELGYLPSVEELTLLLGEDERKIEKVLKVAVPLVYLDEHENAYVDQCTCNHYETVDADVTDRLYVESVLEKLRAKLSDTEYAILECRLNELSQTQTAKELGVSPMRVSRTIKKISRLLSPQMQTK